MRILNDITFAIYQFFIRFHELLSWSYEINFGGDIGVVNVSIIGSISIGFIFAVIIAKLVALVIPN